ncbi:uncharacterized protein BDW43DRAFT_261965 [Aspergillus alliaceus]|uniref:uncharacterized protein n=1 Tax=Petromyces alliaceus TaxID=209559 RepID=UPI0012A4334A|nr:uncharacterized protein BDW43DRAFT_261965 [Aspergillus alliaceus]KAB8238532.1 hypothetical protein BDW43DRAFT_261965 [Aspergillus alliaceus]
MLLYVVRLSYRSSRIMYYYVLLCITIIRGSRRLARYVKLGGICPEAPQMLVGYFGVYAVAYIYAG